MQRFLCSVQRHGSFDFFSNIIVLDQYEFRDKEQIEKAIRNAPCSDVEEQLRNSEIRALIWHEVTHFLDLTCTRWGLQYIHRKLRLVDGILNGSRVDELKRVFMLNTTEIEIHKDLTDIDESTPFAACASMHHYLKYSERYGAIVMLCYNKDKKDEEYIHNIPLSMLSVIEANATANEFLSRIKDLDLLGEEEKIVASYNIKRDFDEILNNLQLVEYSALLRLVRLHFNELSLYELLIFVSALGKFTLDSGELVIAALANPIEKSFGDLVYARTLCMDLRRGASRPVIFFKTVLLMYGWMQGLESTQRKIHLDLIKSDANKAITVFWKSYYDIDCAKLEITSDFKHRLTWFDDHTALPDSFVINQSSLDNRKLLELKPPGLLALSDLKLLNILLSDHTEIDMPNRVDMSVLKNFDTHLKTYSQLDASYRCEKAFKFHMSPESSFRALPF